MTTTTIFEGKRLCCYEVSVYGDNKALITEQRLFENAQGDLIVQIVRRVFGTTENTDTCHIHEITGADLELGGHYSELGRMWEQLQALAGQEADT